ncbi:MAG: hypothetical protein ACXWP0_01170 [Ktedonobacterales bacterium]
MEQTLLASNDYLCILQGEGGRIIFEPNYSLSVWLESNQYEYPTFDEIFEGLHGWTHDWGFNLGCSHNLPIFWHESEPEKRWTWPEHEARDIRRVWEDGDNTELTVYRGQDIEVRGETVYYACPCGEKFAIATAREILTHGINCYGSCGDCGARYHLQVAPLKFVW